MFIKLSAAIFSIEDIIAVVPSIKGKECLRENLNTYTIRITFRDRLEVLELIYESKTDRDADYTLLATALCSKEG